MVQMLNGAKVPIGSDQENGLVAGSDLAPDPPGYLLQKLQAFFRGAPLPHGLAWAIIQLASLFFWVALAGAIYRFWR